jgi:hypothetical protein
VDSNVSASALGLDASWGPRNEPPRRNEAIGVIIAYIADRGAAHRDHATGAGTGDSINIRPKAQNGKPIYNMAAPDRASGKEVTL